MERFFHVKKKKTAFLDLTDCKYYFDLHERIMVALGFPECYGANLPAFRDFLSTECDADEIIICGESTVSDELKPLLKQIYGVIDDEVEKRAEFAKKYKQLKPLSYRRVEVIHDDISEKLKSNI